MQQNSFISFEIHGLAHVEVQVLFGTGCSSKYGGFIEVSLL